MVRDELAFIRTHLANERTTLAYIRTSLAFVAAGVGLLHFMDSLASGIAGWCFIVSAILVLLIGFYRIISVRKKMKKLRHEEIPIHQ